MNHSYASIFNRRLGIWQVASELVRGTGKASRTICKSLLTLVLGTLATTAMADVDIGAGQMAYVPGGSYSSPWFVNGALNVFAGGILNIYSGARVISSTSYLGSQNINNTGAGTGTVNLSQRAKWDSDILYIGYGRGNGVLNITDGGTVLSIFGIIGSGAGISGTGGGISGTVNINGTGSNWLVTNLLSVGADDNATVTIDNAGMLHVTGNVLMAQSDRSSGTLNLFTTGNARGVLMAGYVSKGTGTATLNWSGGILRADGNEGNFLRNLTSSDVIIGNAGAYFDTNGYTVGLNAASLGGAGNFTKLGQGILTLNGSSSGILSQINAQEDTLVIAGDIGSTSGLVDYTGGDISKTAIVKVEGAGNKWTNSGAVMVGASGTGELAIADGGTVHNLYTQLSQSFSGNATLQLDGSSTARGVLETGYVSKGTGTAAFNWNGGVLRATGNEGNFLRNLTSSDVIISNAGAYFDSNGYIVGLNAASLGGAGNFTKLGQGILTLNGSSSGILSQINAQEDTLVIAGDIGSTSGLVDYTGGDISKTAIVKVEGAGNKWTNSGAVMVGASGTGELAIADGGTVHNLYTQLSQSFSGNATLQLDGSSTARGVLETGYVSKGTGTATFNWNGGILRATGNEGNFLRNFASSDVLIGSASAYLDTNSYDVGINTILNGTGGLSKLGLGTLTLTAANTYNGNTEINAGTLRITNTGSLASAVNVNNGGTLAGSGTVRNTTVQDGGTVHAEATTLTIDGNYIQNGNATLRVDASSATDYSKLYVTGTASFAANTRMDVNVNSINTLALGNILTDVVKADAGLHSTGFNVTDNSALFNFRAIAHANVIDLQVLSNSATGMHEAVIENRHWSALGAADVLDTQLGQGASGDMGQVITALGQLSTNRDVSRAVTQTLPFISGNQAIQGTLTSFQRLLQSRTAGDSGSGLSSGDALQNKAAWARAFGSRATQDDRNGTVGFSADSWGMAFGADAEISSDARFGVAYGYAKTSVNGNTDLAGSAQRANIDSHIVSAYGSKAIGNDRRVAWQADVGLSDSKSTRQMQFGGLSRSASADYRTYSAHLGVAMTQHIALSNTTTLTPGLRADYSWLKSQSYSETGANALDLNVNAHKTDAFVLGADAYLQHRYSAASRLDVNIGVGYDTINKRGNIVAAYAGAPGQAFVTPGIDHSPWLVRGGIGFVHTTANGTEITLRYDAEGRSDYLNHTASVRANWTF